LRRRCYAHVDIVNYWYWGKYRWRYFDELCEKMSLSKENALTKPLSMYLTPDYASNAVKPACV
jgi:hypothetical protein